MCTCKKDIEARLLERFKKNEPTAKDHDVSLTGYAMFFGGNVSVKGVMAIKSTAVFTLKKGGEKQRTISESMVFTYCPFCGQRYEPAAD